MQNLESNICESNIGVGLRSPHYSFLVPDIDGPLAEQQKQDSKTAASQQQKIDKNKTPVKWFEALSENYMDSQGRPLSILKKIREDFPVALHGVGLSIGSTSGLNENYLKSLEKLIDSINPFIISDHLCWTGLENAPTHDLLPLPYTEEAIQLVTNHLDQLQNRLRCTFTIENVSTYLRYRSSEMTEWEFISEIQKRSGCTLLLDLNNVYVNSFNHDFDPKTYIQNLPIKHVRQIHLAGHTNMKDFLFDTHSAHVCQEVWELLRYTKELWQKTQPSDPLAVMVEWDDDIPEWTVLEAEAQKAKDIWEAPQNET